MAWWRWRGTPHFLQALSPSASTPSSTTLRPVQSESVLGAECSITTSSLMLSISGKSFRKGAVTGVYVCSATIRLTCHLLVCAKDTDFLRSLSAGVQKRCFFLPIVYLSEKGSAYVRRQISRKTYNNSYSYISMNNTKFLCNSIIYYPLIFSNISYWRFYFLRHKDGSPCAVD